METSRLLNLILILLLPFYTFSQSAATATATVRPGFVFTRTRGRCTSQFWISKREAWPRMIPQTSTVSKVFGPIAYERFGSEMTLMEATTWESEEEKGFSRLLKEATAALLNSYSRRNFPYSAWEVKTLLIQALVSEDAAALQSHRFALANESCD